jgi:hypothetical protein
MIEKVIGGGNVVKQISNRIGMETVGVHLSYYFPLPWREGKKGRGIQVSSVHPTPWTT